MSTSLSKIRIIPWDSRSTSDGQLLSLPAGVDLPELQQTIGDISPAALIPPHTNDWHLNATAAVMVRGAFLGHRIMAPIPATSVKEARKYLEIFAASGFDAFAFPEAPGGSPIQHRAGFWNMSGVLQPEWWIHLAGSGGREIPADVPGMWTWSEEEL